MQTDMEKTLSALKRELANHACPSIVVDAAGRICHRNRKAIPLFLRRRNLSPFLVGIREEDATMILRPVCGNTALIWVAPLRDGLRKILFLRWLTDWEETLMRHLMTGAALIRRETALVMETEPQARKLIPRMERFLRLICGPDAVWTDAQQDQDRVTVTITFGNGDGIPEDFKTLFQGIAAGETVPSGGSFAGFAESGIDLQWSRRDGKGELRITLSSRSRLPACFIQGRKKRKKQKKQDL